MSVLTAVATYQNTNVFNLYDVYVIGPSTIPPTDAGSPLVSVAFGNTVTSLGDNCFSTNYTSLTTVTFESGSVINSFGNNCFLDCTSLTTIVIPNTVLSLGSDCFLNCTNLTSITISSGVTSLTSGCFGSCSSLTTIEIPNGVTSLGASCFYYCTSLTTITIPSSVTSLGDECFNTCTGLVNITYANPSAINSLGTLLFTSTPVATVNFYLTPSVPDPATGVYNTSLYTTSSSFNYYSGASCYNEGTLILVFKDNLEQYVKIEDLRPGDLVKTYSHGYKPVELIGKNNIINISNDPLKSIYKIDDLYITGGHYISIDNIGGKCYTKEMLIDDKYFILACEHEKATQIIDNNIYTIYHLVLSGENERYGIYVGNGILSETTTKKNFLKHKFILLK